MNEQMIQMQENGLEQMKSVQTQIADLHERIADSIVGAMPELPAPFAEYLPKPKEAVENYFNLVGEIHAANRQFVERVVGAWDRETAAAE